jgi:hypothetical protein
MRFIFSKDLLIILISLFILSSCKNPQNLGEDLLDDPTMGVGNSEDLTINSHIVLDDSISGSTAAFITYLVGNFQDPVFGNSKANLAAQLLLSKNNVNFGNGATLDSAVLIFNYVSDTSTRFYGDKSSVLQIKVHELKESISADSTYYSNRIFNYDVDTLGTKTFKVNYKDSIVIQDIIQGEPDGTQKVRPQVRIRIDKLGQKLIAESGTANLGDNTAFLNYLKGLYVTTERISGDGGIMNFDLSTTSGGAGIILYYKSEGDTSNFVFNINSSSVRTRQFTHDYTGSIVGQHLNDTTLGQQVVYLQPMAGVRAKLSFPNIRHLYDSGLVTINKAELIVNVDPNTDATFSAAGGVALVGIDEEDKRVSLNTASLNTSNKQYKIDITAPVQDILNDKLKLKAIYLECGNKPIRANRIIAGGPQSTSSKMYLKVVYTKLY